MTIPYTYLIGWSNKNLWYYGVRYAHSCDPSDLWVKYKTSSRYVKECTNLYGDPDVIEVRRTFTTKVAAKNWEDVVLRRLNAVYDDKWLNKANLNSFKSVIMTDEIKENISLAKKSSKTSNIKRRCINDGENHRYIPITDELPSGWFEGMSEKRNKQNKENRHNQLKNQTEEQIKEIGRKISSKTKGKSKPPGHGENVSKATRGVPKTYDCSKNLGIYAIKKELR